ncbi:putative aldouronate transport system substrate-binding protein [Paenibacillus rhizosphaerae]|uniref:Putative aldouronate transport system substrate-binding protein n=1 Tax=Paenibacillus rhizosphaerae TaxID=297318 RepID=A0A839TT50_9BACL|nr:extracellular solute-binding protein [Paenibacillus rhizosphaerae]MBB3128459.1 putative aldouronate transport system substrate-binding protein [Paenibacillus rhizosphaerae]
MRKRRFRLDKTKIAVSVLLIAALLVGCSGGGGGGGATGDGPLNVSIMTMYYTPEPPGEDNVVVKEIEKRTNTKLNITWVSPNNYADKVNVTLASGDIPDLMLLDNAFTAQVRTMVAQGALWDLTPYIKDYPNLMKFPEETWTNTKQADGKNYGIPRVRPVEGGGFVYLRKDWMDKLNLEVPQTVDEFYDVLKAFVEKDPDGNGKDDTIGYASFVDQSGMATLGQLQNVFTKTNGDWSLVDGKLVNVNLLPGVRDALVWMNKAYREKLLPEDLATLKNSQAKDLLKAGRAGGFQDTVEAAWEPTEELRKTEPKADFLPLVSLNGYVNRDSGFFGMYAIPKTVPEAKMKKLLELMDYGASDEGSDLASFGIKDVHYKEENGVKVPTEQAKTDIVAQQALGQIFIKYDKYLRAYRSGMPSDILERNKKIIDERAKVSVPEVAVGLNSDTNTKVGTELGKKIQDMKTKVILGKAPIEEWDRFVGELKNDPDLLKITEEMNASYQQRISGSK